jgi:hypothetical protein
LHRGGGSVGGIVGVARSVTAVTKGRDPGTLLFSVVACNEARPAKTLVFRLAPTNIPGHPFGWLPAHVEWLGESDEPVVEPVRAKDKSEQLRDFLRTTLERGGSQPKKVLVQLCEDRRLGASTKVYKTLREIGAVHENGRWRLAPSANVTPVPASETSNQTVDGRESSSAARNA